MASATPGPAIFPAIDVLLLDHPCEFLDPPLVGLIEVDGRAEETARRRA